MEWASTSQTSGAQRCCISGVFCQRFVPLTLVLFFAFNTCVIFMNAPARGAHFFFVSVPRSSVEWRLQVLLWEQPSGTGGGGFRFPRY